MPKTVKSIANETFSVIGSNMKGALSKSVYCIFDKETDNKYILKLFNNSSEHKELYEFERYILKLLNNDKHFPQYYGSIKIVDKGVKYDGFLIEYLGSDTLTSYCTKLKRYKSCLKNHSGLFTEREIWGYLKQLLIGAQSMHKKKIIHNDIKPDNIMIMDGVIKYIDFNLACVDSSSCKYKYLQCRYTPNGGTEQYKAPESFKRKRNSDRYKFDVYGIGKTIIEMVNCEFGFHDLSNRIVSKDYTGKKYSDELREFIKRLVHDDPSQRYSVKQALKKLH